MTSAGKVKMAPAATASPADAMVWTTLFSRMVVPPSIRRIAIEITAAGMLAETVSPAYRPRYALAAPSKSASTTPRTAARAVNSRTAGADADEGDDSVGTAQLYAIANSRSRTARLSGKRTNPAEGILHRLRRAYT